MLSVANILNGHWTWLQLTRELAPIVLVSGASFFAGYNRGWNQGVSYVLGFESVQKMLHGDRA